MTKIRGKDLPLAERSPWRNRMLKAEADLELYRRRAFTLEIEKAELQKTIFLAVGALGGIQSARVPAVLRLAVERIFRTTHPDTHSDLAASMAPTETHRNAVNEAGRAAGEGDEK